jgi:osmotically inducible protein OsmC
MEGSGTIVSTTSGAIGEQSVSWPNRAEDSPTSTSPEELIAAAHAACFSMALANALAQKGYIADQVNTEATVRLERVEGALGITRIDLRTEATVPGVSDEVFQAEAAAAKANCPVSKALAAVEITLDATLRS